MIERILWHRRARTDEDGSDILATCLMATVWVLIICGVIAAVRWSDTTSTVGQVAEAAARDATLRRDASAAAATAQQSVQTWATAQNLKCTGLHSDVDTSGFRAPLGTTGFVRVTVSCDVTFSDLFIPGMPGTSTVTRTATSAIDAYRERS